MADVEQTPDASMGPRLRLLVEGIEVGELQWVRGCAAAVAISEKARRCRTQWLQWVRGCAAAVAAINWIQRGFAVKGFNGSAAAQPR
ncbi:MAG: hypothetical protein ABSB42_22685 [Tepidisphaeraceae bacterium]